MVTLLSQGISIAIQLAGTVILARLLLPEDYGILAMVAAVTSFAGLFRDLGLSSAAIQQKNLTRAQQSNLFWLNVAMGTLLTGLVACASPLIVWFYGKSELLWVTVALSFSFLIGSFGSQHGAMLVRNMQYGRKAVTAISGALVGLVVSVALALQGWSYWALVWGNIAGGVTTTISLLVLSPFRPGAMAGGSGIRGMLKFGANVTAFDFVNYFARNLDNVLIGRLSGEASLGLYSRAYQLLMFPINAIRGPINAVAFPAMSRLPAGSIEFRNYYNGIANIVAALSMPITAFLFVNSKEVIYLSLGEQWGEVVPLFSVLAIASFLQPVASLRGTILLSSGQGRRYLMGGVISSSVVSAGFVIGSFWGAVGVAISYVASVLLLALPMHIYCIRGTAIRFGDFFRVIALPVFFSFVAAGLVFLVKEYLNGSTVLVRCMASLIVFLSIVIPFWFSVFKRSAFFGKSCQN